MLPHRIPPGVLPNHPLIEDCSDASPPPPQATTPSHKATPRPSEQNTPTPPKHGPPSPQNNPPRQDSFLAEGFILDKRIGVGQPRRIEGARVLIANTPMDTDKIKIYGARVKVDSMAKVGAGALLCVI